MIGDLGIPHQVVKFHLLDPILDIFSAQANA